jgi:tetratricopeptide (TPR) repeat protein
VIGAGLANRGGDRPATLPGLGEQRPGAGQLPSVQDRRDSLQNRLEGRDRNQVRDDRQQNRDDRQQNREQIRDDRRQNWDQVRNDWQERRDEVRNDWQGYRDDARDDWQGWFDDHYGRYGGWYAGYAPGYWGQWDYLWDSYPVAAAVGLTWWGANSLGWQFGYSDYSNPYYVESMPVYYSEPVISMPLEPVPQSETATAQPPGVSADAVAQFDQARAAFLEGKYDAALKLTNAAIAQMPRDAVLHEFQSLVLFALGRFSESAAAIHPVLAVGPGWDWKTLIGLYASEEVYTSQLRVLEIERKKKPKDVDLHFLLGYHYLTCGFPEEALGEWRWALDLLPNDSVTASLVATLSPRDSKTAQAPAGAAPKAIPAEQISGDWSAAGKGTSKYSMSLRNDGTFTWGFARRAKKEEVKGVYSIEGNFLAMEPDSGGVMLAELTVKEPNTLHFKMIGGAKDDPGLEFQRGPSKENK